MKYVTIPQLCAHARKHRSTILDALRASCVPISYFPGVKGGRILLREANKFLARHWPDAGQITNGGES